MTQTEMNKFLAKSTKRSKTSSTNWKHLQTNVDQLEENQ